MITNHMTGRYDFKRPGLDGYDWPALSEIVERVESYGADLAETTRRVKELENSRRDAERKDTAAFAEAIQSGRKDPGTPNADELQVEIRDATRRREALRVALQGLGPELLSVIEEGRSAWLPQVQDGLSGATERLEEARQAMRRAEAELSRHRELIAWLEDPQDYRPGQASKERQKAPQAKPPVFSVIGGRPSSEATSDGSATHALRVTRGPASPGAGAA